MEAPIALTDSLADPTQMGRPSLWKQVLQLAKLRLSLLVVFSGVVAFALGRQAQATWQEWVLFGVASLFTTISANIVNQILERGPDGQMHRTRTRPLPTGNMQINQAWWLVAAFGIPGLAIYPIFFSGLSFWLALTSWVLYSFVYTPLKRITPLAVAIGAIPGAMPLLIGFAAATGTLGPEAILLFIIQFIWQFPHFWSLAWVLADDYARGGFRLLPTKGSHPNALTAGLMFLYTTLLIPAGWMPYFLGYISLRAALVCTIAGLLFLYPNFKLCLKQDKASARGVMFGSFLYLPAVQIAILLDKLG
jgi:protoheme IX farnesyltransferase